MKRVRRSSGNWMTKTTELPTSLRYIMRMCVNLRNLWMTFWSMRISEMNWMMVEEYLRRDDRAVLPLGCTEQHAYLSLSTDSILAEGLAVEAAGPLSVPVFSSVPFGNTPYFPAISRTITLS